MPSPSSARRRAGCISGKRIPCQVDSICVHGDGPTAVTVSKAVREGLEAAGIRIVPLTEMPNLKH
jgi:5-oxoprolinase (ATP-hydrolysing) subunit A